MLSLKDRDVLRRPQYAIALSFAAIASIAITLRGADQPSAAPAPMFRQYCFQCHSNGKGMGGMNLDQLVAKSSVGENFQQWQKVAAVLESGRMPPKGMPQPPDADRRQAATWVTSELTAYIKKHDGDTGRVTVRRLTSGEYDYAVEDLTGVDIDTGIDASTDSVGGEGFTNFGDVQFMQDASLERYLEAARKIADHAVIGAGPLEFYTDPGKSGFEMSAINRIKETYGAYGFRTVSGEGGFPFGLDRYDRVFYAAWRYRNRAALGEPNVTIKELAAREGLTERFVQHVWGVVNNKTLAYPTSEMAARWQKIPAPAANAPEAIAAAKKSCQELEKFVTTWTLWMLARGDAAVGGAGDESPLILTEKALKVGATHHFVFNRGGRFGGGGGGAAGGRGPAVPAGPAKIYLNVAALNPTAKGKPVVIWKNPTVAYRQAGVRSNPNATAIPAGDAAADPAAIAARRLPPAGAKQALRAVVSPETAEKLGFGKSIDGAAMGPDDFASELSVSFEVPNKEGSVGFQFDVEAVVGADRDQVFRIVVTDREDGGSRGIPIRTLLGDPESTGVRTFKAGVMQLTSLLPPNSHNEPTPADKDPIPEPFDSTYNVPEHDEFDTRVKYIRDDKFIYQNVLDDAARARVDQAWHDVYASFAYHDNYLDLIAKHFKLDLKGKHIGDLDDAALAGIPAEPRQYIQPLIAGYRDAMKAEAAARPRHIQDCLEFASRAWRRPLTEREKQSLRTFYDTVMTSEKDHQKAIRALLTRILVSPAFLYRVEQPADIAAAAAKPLGDWEMASRLSFLIWSSVPDDELRRAAAAGELATPAQLQAQARRMLADPKARRLSTEFFAQWLGFYHFDQFKGVDTSRFPEFTEQVRSSMYDEAVSFFEHIIRKDRPVREILTADYDFLNQPLAKYYGIKKPVAAKDHVELVEGAPEFQRGGLLRLGAVLTAFSAPLRTSPVKRGDWVLRRILGVAVPPPPADAGSIPADDKLFGGLTVKQRLEQHKRNATCANCHMRIDPLGFPLEHYDSTGRWRDQYSDGKPVEDTASLSDHTEIDGVKGLLDYLQTKDDQVRRTLAYKLTGYALGRTVQASDQPMIDRIVALGPNATFSQVVGELVTSKQFRNRPTGAPVAPAPPAPTRAAVIPNKAGAQ